MRQTRHAMAVAFLMALTGIALSATAVAEARSSTPGSEKLAQLTSSSPSSATAPTKIPFNIEPQSLEDALNQFARQSGYQVLFQSAVVQKQMAPRVSGVLAPETALQTLLSNSTLRYKFVNPRTVTISTTDGDNLTKLTSSSDIHLAQNTTEGSGQTAQQSSTEGATQGPQDPTASEASKSKDSKESLKEFDLKGIPEVLVTAQKQQQRLQDVPVPVTAIGADALVNGNQLRLQDYYTKIPGLNVTPASLSTSILSIRGLVTGGGNPTVGITIDDVPYGASTLLGGGGVVPDIDPSELAHIEVLRGPQGTLYGASSMGGLIKFVTDDPSTENLSGRLQVGTTGVYNGDELGYAVRGAVNVPIGDTFAVRASASTRRDPGYIDDPTHGLEDVNSVDVKSGRLSALWRISDTFSLKLGAVLQRNEGDGASGSDIGLPELQQNRLQGTGWYDRKVQAYSATATADLGRVELTSLTGYNVNTYNDSFDAGYLYGTAVRPLFGVTSAELQSDNRNTKFTEELRLSVPLGKSVEWLFGAFYTDEDARFVQTIRGVNPTTAVRVGTLRSTVNPTTFEEYAAFTDLTFHFTNRFDVQVGGRQSEIRQTYEQSQTGAGATAAGNIPEQKVQADAFTYLVTPRFTVTPNFMTYARLASGYRAGGANTFAGPGTPPQYDPDKTKSYELGVKASAFDRALSVDASVYYIDWNDIQLAVVSPTTLRGYFVNAGGAKSQGVELSVEIAPIDGMTISSWVAWNDAELTEGFPATSPTRAKRGDRLPFSSRISGSFSLDQEFPFGSSLKGVVGGSVNYIGKKQGGFTGGTGARQIYPGYAQLDLRTGLKYDSWTANLFATNLTDKRAAFYGGPGSSPPYALVYVQPRTVGLSITKVF